MGDPAEVVHTGQVLSRIVDSGDAWLPYYARISSSGKIEFSTDLSFENASACFQILKGIANSPFPLRRLRLLSTYLIGSEVEVMEAKDGKIIIFIRAGKTFTEFSVQKPGEDWTTAIRDVAAHLKKSSTNLPFRYRKSAIKERRASSGSDKSDKSSIGSISNSMYVFVRPTRYVVRWY